MAILPQVFTVGTMVSGSSITPAVELAGDFLNMYLVVPTMTGGYSADTQIFVQGSADNVNFYRYCVPQGNTSTVSTNDLVIPSGSTQRIVWLPGFTLRYARLETTAVATAGVSLPFKFICVSNQ